MISVERLREIAFWAGELSPEEIEQARRGIVEKTYPEGAYLCHSGDRVDCWHGVISGLIKLGAVSKTGKAATLAGLREGAWFGEGTVIKNEPRRYDIVALRETRMALMNRASFNWLFERSAGFNRFLVRQLNERLGQFIAFAEYDRILDAPARLARTLAWLFNPVLYPDEARTLAISQEEVGSLAGLSRQAANQCLARLESEGILKIGRGSLTVLDLARLSEYGG